MLEGGRRGDADAEMLGCQRDGRDELQRVVDRNLRRLLDRVEIASLVDVIVANHVGNKDAVENTAFQRPGKILPVVQILVFVESIARMRPQPRGLVTDTIHVECIESNLPGHGRDSLVSRCRFSAIGCGKSFSYLVLSQFYSLSFL